MDDRRRRLRARLFIGVAVGATGLILVAFALHFFFFETLQRSWVDVNYSLVRERPTPKDVVVVGVDSFTLDDLQTRWPFPRSYEAASLRRICAARPKAIAFDIQFTEPSTGPNGAAQDNALINAVAACKHKVVLSTTEWVVDKHGHSHTNIFGGDSVVKRIGAFRSIGLVPADSGGSIRHMRYEIGGIPTLAIAAAEVAKGHPVTEADMGGPSTWIDFPGPGGTVKEYSFSQTMPVQIVHHGNGPKPWYVFPGGGLDPNSYAVAQAATKAGAEAAARKYLVPASAFRGKVVVIGVTAPSLGDIHATATDPVMAGPEVQADAVDTALRGFPLRSLAWYWNVLLIVLLGVVVPFASLRSRPLVAVATGVFFGAFFTGGVILGFSEGRVVSYIYPISALILASIGSIVIHYLVTAFEKERVRDVFSRFVPETVVDQVLAKSGDDLRLGGREVVGTVMFSDLRGFTSSAEFMPADKVIHVLNHYLHEMSEAILHHGGTLLCYMGDGIYALFGAPLDQDDHADRALAAAREMLTERLPGFNEFMREQDLGEGYFMGVGLNTGPVMTGNVGHERRMDYTAVGDIVNTASRIEGMTKATPYSVLIAESTVESLRNPPGDIVFFEEQSVRGRKEKLKLYALDIKKPEDAPDLVAARSAKPKSEGPATEAPPAPALG